MTSIKLDPSPTEAWFDTMQELTLNNHERRVDSLIAASTLAANSTTLTVNATK